MENPTSANQTETDNALWQTNTRRTSSKQTWSYSSNTDNNTERGLLWTCPTASGTLAVTYLDVLGGNCLQSGTPHRMSHSERETSDNNLTSVGFPSGTNRPNGSPMGNPSSIKT